MGSFGSKIADSCFACTDSVKVAVRKSLSPGCLFFLLFLSLFIANCFSPFANQRGICSSSCSAFHFALGFYYGSWRWRLYWPGFWIFWVSETVRTGSHLLSWRRLRSINSVASFIENTECAYSLYKRCSFGQRKRTALSAWSHWSKGELATDVKHFYFLSATEVFSSDAILGASWTSCLKCTSCLGILILRHSHCSPIFYSGF